MGRTRAGHASCQCELDLTPHATDPGMQRLWDALASVLALGDVVLYFPGGRPRLVARGSVTQHLPPSMVEALGQPVVVTTGREIQHEIDVA